MAVENYSVIIRNNKTYEDYVKVWGDGHIECHSRGQLAFAESWSTCVAYQLPFILEDLHFGFITSALSILIIIISIFGGIKDNYKFFILHQAVWDFLVSYDFICDKPSLYYFGTNIPNDLLESWNEKPATCFFSSTENPYTPGSVLATIMHDTMLDIQFPLLFMLAFSRFLNLFCPRFYQKHSTPVKICIFIILFDTLSIFLLTSFTWYSVFRSKTDEGSTTTLYLGISIAGIRHFTVLSFLLLTFGFTLAVIIKISQQLKHQYRHNRKKLSCSLRISSVLLFQCFTFVIFFSLSFVNKFLDGWLAIAWYIFFKQSYVFFTPNWMTLMIEVPQPLNLLRIFLDDIIILTILTGYCDVVKSCFKTIGRFLKSFINNFRFSNSNVTMFSDQKKNSTVFEFGVF